MPLVENFLVNRILHNVPPDLYFHRLPIPPNPPDSLCLARSVNLLAFNQHGMDKDGMIAQSKIGLLRVNR